MPGFQAQGDFKHNDATNRGRKKWEQNWEYTIGRKKLNECALV